VGCVHRRAGVQSAAPDPRSIVVAGSAPIRLETATKSFDEWRPSIEGLVDDIKLTVDKSKMEVSKISRNWERAVLDLPATTLGVLATSPASAPKLSSTTSLERPPPPPFVPTQAAPIERPPLLAFDGKAPTVVERPPLGATESSPHGHGVATHHWESGYGVVSTLIHSPVRGGGRGSYQEGVSALGGSCCSQAVSSPGVAASSTTASPGLTCTGTTPGGRRWAWAKY